MKKSRFTESQIVPILKEADAGAKAPAVELEAETPEQPLLMCTCSPATAGLFDARNNARQTGVNVPQSEPPLD